MRTYFLATAFFEIIPSDIRTGTVINEVPPTDILRILTIKEREQTIKILIKLIFSFFSTLDFSPLKNKCLQYFPARIISNQKIQNYFQKTFFTFVQFQRYFSTENLKCEGISFCLRQQNSKYVSFYKLRR